MIYTLEEIKKKILPIAIKYQLPAVYLFGSYARGTADEGSDLDFLIDTGGTKLKSLFALGALYNELKEVFQKPIDLITVSALEQPPQMNSEISFHEMVWKEKVIVYDAA